ncbi:hypothetical protein [Candidatus Enterococcus ikei]|uniref:Phage protein n=1 Tax=Candidatus Enterococcus ikei TaxID=2815326 RepID=A0ABS3GWM0_9ENTE|nr:hypothetical protein [Enterococcus sp. DIV0869a]MBO0439585.1 hypothetical protein [Enterococcus sp. DIV0869a]
MPNYICNKHADDKGRHEIHDLNCSYLPLPENRVSVGTFSNCREAIRHMEQANQGKGFNFDGCYWCCRECHTG